MARWTMTGWRGALLDGRMYLWIDGYVDKWMDGQMDAWMGG